MTERTEELPALSDKTPLDHRRGKIGIKYKRIAYLASKGLKPEVIAQDVGLSTDRINKILARKDVWEEAKRCLRESFQGSERFMVTLLEKALQGLEDQMVSGSADEKKFAIDRVLKLFQGTKTSEGNKTLIQQFFGSEAQNPDKLNDIILQKRRERGLPDLPDPNDL